MVKPYWLFIAGIVLLTILVAVSRVSVLAFSGFSGISELSPYEGFASSGPMFYMFGVDWCPHCTSAKPEFLALGSTKTIGGKSVEMRFVNPENEPEAAEGFEIEGYPTLYLVQSSGQKVKYQGQRTTDGFLQFLQKNVA